MRVLVLGGTKFIGRALAEELHRRDHDMLIVHRGEHEPEGWLDVQHLHRDRGSLSESDVSSFAPDVVVDTSAMTHRDAELAVTAVRDDVRFVVLSSMDAYEAYGNLLAGRSGEPVPLAEDAPVRSSRYPYRGRYAGMEDYEKLDVEGVYRARRAVVCRLPAVFGPHDEQRREDFILRRVVAGRTQIPFGAGNWLWSRLHVHDAAVALASVVEHRQIEDAILNIGPASTLTVRQWATAILSAAGSTSSLVPVPDTALPGDLWLSASIGQHILADSSKARALLNWRDRDPTVATADSVAWHLDHYIAGDDTDWTPDDSALAAVVQPP